MATEFTCHLADDGWVEHIRIVERECDLRGKTVPMLHARRVAFPFMDGLMRLNQYGEADMDVGKAEFDVIDMGMRVVQRKVLHEDRIERVRLVRETHTLLQWSILWPENQPRPMVTR